MQQHSITSRNKIVFNAAALFFLSFLMSGNGNVLPQLFFQHFYPEQKVLLLSIALFSSTIASILGVLLSRRAAAGSTVAVAGLLGITAAVLALLTVRDRAIYIELLILIQFGDNYLLNQLDHAASALAGDTGRRLHDVLGNAARLLGMLAGPAFFTIFYAHQSVLFAAVGSVGVIASAGAAILLAGHAHQSGRAATTNGVHPDLSDRLLFSYAASVYAALYLFAGNMIYLLRDLLAIPDAETRGGITIVTVFGAALTANAVFGVMNRTTVASGRIRLVPFAAPAVVLFVPAGLLAVGVRASFPLFLSISALVGISYGGFLLAFRDYVSFASRQGKAALLTWFNNLANISALLAFGLMLLLAAVASHGARGPYFLTLCLISGLPAAGSLLLIAASSELSREYRRLGVS